MKKIFVGNLDFSATEASLRSLFEPYGTVESVHLVTDRDTGAREVSRLWIWRKPTPTRPSLR
jgi:RNA recognition motif-containing protein